MEKEEKTLESVNFARLTHSECSQCIDRQITEIKDLGAEVLTDPTLNDLLAELETSALEFHHAILQIQKSPYTDILTKLDGVRDRALRNYEHALRQFKYTEISEELKAYHKLLILSTTYKGIDVMNYEAETKDLKKYLEALASDQFNAEVTLLDLGSCITKVKNSSTDFNLHYDSRSNESNSKAVLNALLIRKSLQKQYNQFGGYILALANGLNKEPFNSSLKIMNTTRKSFDVIVKKREGLKGAEDKPETETPN